MDGTMMKDRGMSDTPVQGPVHCFSCERSKNSGIWRMGLDKHGQAHFSCPFCHPLLFNVFRVRVLKPKQVPKS